MLAIPQKIAGKFSVRNKIGRGAYGQIYAGIFIIISKKGINTETNQAVAIKFVFFLMLTDFALRSLQLKNATHSLMKRKFIKLCKADPESHEFIGMGKKLGLIS